LKLFRHYKNKTYRFNGTVRHSETLEELALYECRYENELGKAWVRPFPLFFGTIEVNGEQLPRFQKMELGCETFEIMNDKLLLRVLALASRCFPSFDEVKFRQDLNQHRRIHLILAQIEGQDVAFKLGYPESEADFCNWLEGVDPEYRRVGIASDLMDIQHNWCRSQRYRKIRTSCSHTNRAMLMANLKHDFVIMGTEPEASGMRIIFEKVLI
jgi:GNAT superfamily N-acetyltransferase